MIKISDCTGYTLEMAKKEPTKARPLLQFSYFESTCDETHLGPDVYKTLFRDSKDGEGSTINLRTILRLRD